MGPPSVAPYWLRFKSSRGIPCGILIYIGHRLKLSLSLIGKKEKDLILHDGPAQRGAVLVALQIQPRNSLRNIEIIVRVEHAVAEKFEQAAVDLVGPRLDDFADDSPAVASIFRRVVAGQQAELRNRVRIRVQQIAVVQQIVVQPAVQKKCD